MAICATGAFSKLSLFGAARSPKPNTIAERDRTDSMRDGLVRMIPALRAFARSLCGHRELADDLVQETLLKAWQARFRFEPGSNLKAWLFVILRNEYYSNLRKMKVAADYASSQGRWSGECAPEQHGRLDLADLLRGFGHLSSSQKEALILTARDFTYVEAARISGCAVGTMKSRISRARQQLQCYMDGEPGRESRHLRRTRKPPASPAAAV